MAKADVVRRALAAYAETQEGMRAAHTRLAAAVREHEAAKDAVAEASKRTTEAANQLLAVTSEPGALEGL